MRSLLSVCEDTGHMNARCSQSPERSGSVVALTIVGDSVCSYPNDRCLLAGCLENTQSGAPAGATGVFVSLFGVRLGERDWQSI